MHAIVLSLACKLCCTHSRILAWRIPWTEEPGGLQSTGLPRVSHGWVTDTNTAAHSSTWQPWCPHPFDIFDSFGSTLFWHQHHPVAPEWLCRMSEHLASDNKHLWRGDLGQVLRQLSPCELQGRAAVTVCPSVQFNHSCPTLRDPMDCSMPGLPVHHQLPEFTQTHVHQVSDAIQPSHPLPSPSPPHFYLSQHQGLFEWVSFSHQVAKVLEFQPQHQSFQWTPRTGLL